jgi:hypothetical protein
MLGRSRFRVGTRILTLVAVLVIPLSYLGGGPATASTGTVLRTLSQGPGNGRAIALDPAQGDLYYTDSGDPHIYVIDTSGHPVRTLLPHDAAGGLATYGALSWQPMASGGVLWGGRYDGTGGVDRINPLTGATVSAFTFAFPPGDSCYSQPSGSIDGLAFDTSDQTLWIGDDAARVFFHVRLSGTQLGSFVVPNNLCRSGIASDGNFLWLGLQSGPDTPPYALGRVAKTDPSTMLQNLPFNTGEGPEGLTIDTGSFPGECALWSNQFGNTNTLTAWSLPKGLCQSSRAGAPSPLDAIGVLAITHPGGQGQCNGTVLQSANRRVVLTAGHCVTEGTDFRFAPDHLGPIDDLLGCTHNCLGTSPYGIWHATSSGVIRDARYPNDQAYDLAYIVMDDNAIGQRLGDVAPMMAVQFNQGRSQYWRAYGYPGVQDAFTQSPILSRCSTGSAGSEAASGSVSTDPQFLTMPCKLLSEGSSGGPWTTTSAIGGLNAQQVQPKVLGPTYERGTYLGCQAQQEFSAAQIAQPGSGPTLLSPSC